MLNFLDDNDMEVHDFLEVIVDSGKIVIITNFFISFYLIFVLKSHQLLFTYIKIETLFNN